MTEDSGDYGRLRDAVGKHMFRYTPAGFASYFVGKAKGTYIYYCTPHKSMMQGSIKVT